MKSTIYMTPVPKGRPRFAARNGKVIPYTPKATTHAEDIIRDQILQQVLDLSPDKALFGKDVPLRLEASFFLIKPKSAKRKKPTTKPDADNLLKTLQDALEKFIYENDSQIVTMVIKKRYGYPPRIELDIQEDSDF